MSLMSGMLGPGEFRRTRALLSLSRLCWDTCAPESLDVPVQVGGGLIVGFCVDVPFDVIGFDVASMASSSVGSD